MKCENCLYYWKDENDRFPCCHYNDAWKAPCEDDEDYEEPDESEV